MELGKFVRNRLAVTTLATTVAIGGVAFANRGESDAPSIEAAVTTTLVLTPEQQTAASEVCPDGFNMGTSVADEFSLSVVGGPDSLGSSNLDAKGEMISTEDFSKKVLAEACVRPDYLAAITAFTIEPSEQRQFPGIQTLSRAKELAAQYRENPSVALQALNKLASIVTATNGVKSTDKFNLVTSKATLVGVTRDSNNTATGEELKPIVDGGFRRAFLLSYDLTNPDLNETQRKNLIDLSDLVGFGENGELFIADWFGVLSIDLTPATSAPETTAADATEDTTGDTTTDNGTTPSNGTANGGNNGGGNGGNGGNPGQTSTPDAPGTTGGTTPNDVPGTTGPDTSGPDTTRPGTTNPGTTAPGTTTPRTTTPTTTAVPKGSQPGCVPNPPYVVC